MDMVEVVINGTTYYVCSNQVQYLTDDLVNTSSSNITLYSAISTDGTTTMYPYISIRPYSAPVLHRQNQSNTVMTVNTVEWGTIAQSMRQETKTGIMSMYFLIIIALIIFFRGSK